MNKDEYGFDVGSLIYHIKDVGGVVGIVTEIDSDFDHDGVTTARVLWEATEIPPNLHPKDTDIQWTNKLVPLTDSELKIVER